MTELEQLEPKEFNTIAFIIAHILSHDRPISEISMIGNFLNTIGQNMRSIAIQGQNLSSLKSANETKEMKDSIECLQEQIDRLKKKC